tara:strand:- start:28152 stop:28481 length:330 start_codon:yes stop_codon:yes gene_type:complete
MYSYNENSIMFLIVQELQLTVLTFIFSCLRKAAFHSISSFFKVFPRKVLQKVLQNFLESKFLIIDFIKTNHINSAGLEPVQPPYQPYQFQQFINHKILERPLCAQKGEL